MDRRISGEEPVVVTCALTGGIHGKEANENLPEQPDEIVEQGVAAWEAGAAVLRGHPLGPGHSLVPGAAADSRSVEYRGTDARSRWHQLAPAEPPAALPNGAGCAPMRQGGRSPVVQ